MKKKSVKAPVVKEKEVVVKPPSSDKSGNPIVEGILLPQRVVMQIADEVAKVVTQSMGGGGKKKKKPSKSKKLENPIFLDTSAIIDGRVFDLIKIGLFYGNLVVLEGVLGELKNIADSKDDIKKERGRRALGHLEDLKKQKVKVTVLTEDTDTIPVDDRLIRMAKKHKGRIVTCDFNLSKKAKISNVISIDLYELANILKTTAIPGESFYIKIMQKGKGEGQGVGYLPDGTMVVVERGVGLMGKTVNVEISRVIQTDAGRIFFGKIMADSPILSTD